MSSEYKEKDGREIALVLLAVFLVGIYLFREWQGYPVEKGSRAGTHPKDGWGFKGSSIDLESITSLAKKDGQKNEGSVSLNPRTLEPLNPLSLSGEAKQVLGIKVNINKAAQQDFESLPSIGPKLAQRIIEKRKELGGFKSIDDIKKVKGIGEKKFEKMKALIDIK